MYNMIFDLTDEQYQDIINIIDSHQCNEFGPEPNCDLGIWSYIFTPTELGIFVNVRCNKCGSEWQVSEEDE